MDSKNMEKELKKKRIRKYALAALALLIVIGVVSTIKIESKDSKIPDAGGNVTESIKPPEEEAEAAPEEVTEEETDKDAETGTQIEKDKDKEPAEKTPESDKTDNSEDAAASNGGNKELKPETAEKVTVTIEIRCDTLSSDMTLLENDALKDYIPQDGVILAQTTYTGTTENTVFDVLNAVCRNNDLQLEFSYTPLYEAYYIEGINYLYEFDAGSLSGWMYKVNGWYPNYGCSAYYLSDGDSIQWLYTCDMGKDIGNTQI